MANTAPPSGTATPRVPDATAAAIAEQVFAQLNAQVATRLAALERRVEDRQAPKNVTPAKPDKYNGRPGKAEQWAFEMELYFAATGLQDPQRVPFAAAMLTDHAGIWWRSVCLDPEGPITTWDDFKRQLLFNFQHVDAEQTARRRLRDLKQRTSVAVYFTDFTRATLEIPRISEDEKMDRFLSGLKPALQREIILREPTDVSTHVKLAHKLDEITVAANRDYSFSSRQQRFDRPASGSKPMELGAIHDSRPNTSRDGFRNGNPDRRFHRLTDADRVQLRQEGRCFYCKQPGHIAEYCPNKPGNEKKAGKAPAR